MCDEIAVGQHEVVDRGHRRFELKQQCVQATGQCRQDRGDETRRSPGDRELLRGSCRGRAGPFPAIGRDRVVELAEELSRYQRDVGRLGGRRPRKQMLNRHRSRRQGALRSARLDALQLRGHPKIGPGGREVLAPGVELEHVLAEAENGPAAGPVGEPGGFAVDLTEAQTCRLELGHQACRRLGQSR